MNAKADPENFKESMQYLEFKLSNDLYAINILSIKEIIDHRSMMPLPMTPNFLAGVINLRGSVVPVIELARRFDKEPAEKTNRSSKTFKMIKASTICWPYLFKRLVLYFQAF